MTTVTKQLRLNRERRRKRAATTRKPVSQAVPETASVGAPGSGPDTTSGGVNVVPTGRTPRISKLMALAIRFDRLIQEGKIANQSELARLAHVTQPRMTQIMNLLHLAPDIQEEILFLPRVMEGKDSIHERMLRPVVAELSWRTQRRIWRSEQRTCRGVRDLTEKSARGGRPGQRGQSGR